MSKSKTLGPPFGQPWWGNSGGPIGHFVHQGSIDDKQGSFELELRLDYQHGQEGGVEGRCWVGWGRQQRVARGERLVVRGRADEIFVPNVINNPLLQCVTAYRLELHGQGEAVSTEVSPAGEGLRYVSLVSPVDGEVTLAVLAQITMRYSSDAPWLDGPICRFRGAIESVALDPRGAVGTVEDYEIKGTPPAFLLSRKG